MACGPFSFWCPIVRDQLGPFLTRVFGWTGFFGGTNYGVGLLTASLILSIMILPVISSITRDIMNAVPNHQREAVLALGATRWEMIRTGVLRNARIGIVGAVILGLGRALGETMAVAMTIGNHPGHNEEPVRTRQHARLRHRKRVLGSVRQSLHQRAD